MLSLAYCDDSNYYLTPSFVIHRTLRGSSQFRRAKENLASAEIVKIEFNANLYLLGFPHFITFKECRKVP